MRQEDEERGQEKREWRRICMRGKQGEVLKELKKAMKVKMEGR